MYELSRINEYAERLYYGETDVHYYALRIRDWAMSAKYKVDQMEVDNNNLNSTNESLERENDKLSTRVEQLENELLLAKLQLILKEEYSKAGTTQYNKERALQLRTLISELKGYINILEDDTIDYVKKAEETIEPYKIQEEKEKRAKERRNYIKSSVRNFFFGSNDDEEKSKSKVKTR